MIDTKSICCPNVERKAYIFFHDAMYKDVNKLIGEFIEQSNDAGEIQYVFKFYYDVLTEGDIQRISFPGIDLEQRKDVYIRSGGIPYFVECSVVPKNRGDVKRWLRMHKMDYYDEFEYMLRSRAITSHTNCYLGRTKDDKIDLYKYKQWGSEYQLSHFPNMPCGNPENDYHKIKVE